MNYLKNILKIFLKPLIKVIIRFLLIEDTISQASPIYISANFITSERIEGDYYEFGTFKGESFIRAYRAINHHKDMWKSFSRTSQAYSNIELAKKSYEKLRTISRHYYAFDSFQGLPEINKIDKDHAVFEKGRYDCSEKDFVKNIISNGVDINDVSIISGFFNETLNDKTKLKFKMNKAAIVLIDSDLYSSAKEVLNFITDLVHDGTIIIFDEWFTFKGDPNKGEQKACNEWLNENKHIKLIPYVRYKTYQMSFIVNIIKN